MPEGGIKKREDKKSGKLRAWLAELEKD